MSQAQLGDVLGLTPMDVGSVHSKLAEESFRHQVQAVMGDGNLNKERMDALAGAAPPALPGCLSPAFAHYRSWGNTSQAPQTAKLCSAGLVEQI